VVRNGYQPERDVLTGIGAVKVQVPQDAGSSGRKAMLSGQALLPPHFKEGAAVYVLSWTLLNRYVVVGSLTSDMQLAVYT
jgi:putative transposase